MNAKVAVTITATGDTGKQLSSSDGGFVFNPLLPGPYTVTVEAPSFSRMLSNMTVVAGDRARVDAQLLYCRGAVIAYVEADGIDASGVRVAESDIKRHCDRRWGTCSRKLIPRREKRCFISTNRTCWNKA
jgi:Carboxypeptidase regulatory-like domain